MELHFVTEHLYLVLMSSLFTTLFGLVLGVVSYLSRPVRSVILFVVDVLQTVPVLALLGFIMLLFGGTSTTVIVGIVLYSLLPVVRNTYVGLNNIDPAIKDAARGMGMTRWQRLYMVEMPLAFPMVFTGVRIAVVNSIGVAVFGFVVGGGGLGTVLQRSIYTQDMGTILAATAILMGMAVFFDYGMGLIEKRLNAK